MNAVIQHDSRGLKSMTLAVPFHLTASLEQIWLIGLVPLSTVEPHQHSATPVSTQQQSANTKCQFCCTWDCLSDVLCEDFLQKAQPMVYSSTTFLIGMSMPSHFEPLITGPENP